MNGFDIALQGLKRRAHVVKTTYGPVVKEKISVFATITQEKAAEVGQQFLAAVNVCDPEVRAQIHETFTAIRSRIGSMADAAIEAEPEAREKLEVFAEATKTKLAALGAMMSEAATSVAESEKVQAMVASMSTRVEELKAASLDSVPPKAEKLMATMSDLSDKVAELSKRSMALAKDAYQAERTQAVLASIQAGAGKLAAAAAAKWPDVRSALEEFASASATKIADLSGKAIEAVNLCNPEKRQQVQAAFLAVQSRVSQLATAVAERWPEVQESLQDFAESMSEKFAMISEQVADRVQDLRQREEVQAMIATIQDQVAELNAIVSDKTAAMQEKAQELASSIEENIKKLVPQVFEAEDQAPVDDDGSEAQAAWEWKRAHAMLE